MTAVRIQGVNTLSPRMALVHIEQAIGKCKLILAQMVNLVKTLSFAAKS